MSMARLVVTAVLVEGRTKSEVARSYGVAPAAHQRQRGRWPRRRMRDHRSRRRHVARPPPLDTRRHRLPIRGSPKPPLRRPTVGRVPAGHRDHHGGPSGVAMTPTRSRSASETTTAPNPGAVAPAVDMHPAPSPQATDRPFVSVQLVPPAQNTAQKQRWLEPDNRAPIGGENRCAPTIHRHRYRTTAGRIQSVAPVGGDRRDTARLVVRPSRTYAAQVPELARDVSTGSRPRYITGREEAELPSAGTRQRATADVCQRGEPRPGDCTWTCA
jgi:hypothetical protein